jgi:hypothetical protein
MTTFPALIPSTRTYSPGEYPITPHPLMSGSEIRVRHSNTVLGVRLRLTFQAASSADVVAVRNHYNGRQGGFLPFAIPVELLSGVTTPADFTPAGHQWVYASRPSVVDVPIAGDTPTNRHDLVVELATVPPENTIVSGARITVRATVRGGSAQLGTYIESFASVVGGAATAEASASALGAAITANASVTGGGAQGDPVIDALTAQVSVAGGAASVGGLDPHFANVSLLLSMEGANNSTAFTDLSNNGFAISVYGDAKVVTTDADFPLGALDLDGTGDYLTTPADSAFAFGTGDFTVEFYSKADVISDNDGLFSFGTTQLALALFSSSWYLTTTGSGGAAKGFAASNTRQHVAVTRSGTNLRLFVAGAEVGSASSNSTNFTNDSMNIGFYFSSSFPFDGRMSWLRVTKGVARYTTNFTPPATPFPNS